MKIIPCANNRNNELIVLTIKINVDIVGCANIAVKLTAWSMNAKPNQNRRTKFNITLIKNEQIYYNLIVRHLQ